MYACTRSARCYDTRSPLKIYARGVVSYFYFSRAPRARAEHAGAPPGESCCVSHLKPIPDSDAHYLLSTQHVTTCSILRAAGAGKLGACAPLDLVRDALGVGGHQQRRRQPAAQRLDLREPGRVEVGRRVRPELVHQHDGDAAIRPLAHDLVGEPRALHRRQPGPALLVAGLVVDRVRFVEQGRAESHLGGNTRSSPQ